MCMQTNFGCCLKDGKVIEKKKKTENVKKEHQNKKKVIHQAKVEFE